MDSVYRTLAAEISLSKLDSLCAMDTQSTLITATIRRELPMKLFLMIVLAASLSGCASLGKGVAEAFLEKRHSEDTRQCQVWGESFVGLDPYLTKTKGKTKVLMVHGVGRHIPGYSTEFLEKLAKELDLTVMSRHPKQIQLTDPFDTSKKLGTLRINRLLNQNETKELLFYELTWSEITDPEKAVLDYDNSGEYSFRRADINDMLKKFSNDTGPDPMIYLGKSRDDILVSFRQSFCWMVKSNWDDLPNNQSKSCDPLTKTALENLENDDYALVSHSLGSRIVIDGMQSLAELFGAKNKRLKKFTGTPDAFVEAFRKKQLPIYMLSNQLPLLQMGRELPEVTGQKDNYCLVNGKQYNARVLSKTSIIAFSDPNDLLSYAIPQGFAGKYLDSRLCIDVTNININVANVNDLFGIGELANPLTAHVGYDRDDRVVALIAKGIGTSGVSELVQKRCEWTRLVD